MVFHFLFITSLAYLIFFLSMFIIINSLKLSVFIIVPSLMHFLIFLQELLNVKFSTCNKLDDFNILPIYQHLDQLNPHVIKPICKEQKVWNHNSKEEEPFQAIFVHIIIPSTCHIEHSSIHCNNGHNQ